MNIVYRQVTVTYISPKTLWSQHTRNTGPRVEPQIKHVAATTWNVGLMLSFNGSGTLCRKCSLPLISATFRQAVSSPIKSCTWFIYSSRGIRHSWGNASKNPVPVIFVGLNSKTVNTDASPPVWSGNTHLRNAQFRFSSSYKPVQLPAELGPQMRLWTAKSHPTEPTHIG